MPRDYQLKKGVEPLPHAVYMQVKYIISDYNRLRHERLDILYGSPKPPDGMPKGADLSDPTGVRGARLADINKRLEAIEQSAIEIFKEMSDKVMEQFNPIEAYWSYDYFNYMHRRSGQGDQGPSRRTWNYFKAKLGHKVAEKLRIL